MFAFMVFSLEKTMNATVYYNNHKSYYYFWYFYFNWARL
jgi:hypothetical protein